MTKTTLRTTLLIGLAAAALIGPAEARGFGGFHGGLQGGTHGGFSGRGIAVGEPHPGSHDHGGPGHGGWGSRGHGGWGSHGFGWGFGTVGFAPYYGYGSCFTRRFLDPFGNLVVRRVCE